MTRTCSLTNYLDVRLPFSVEVPVAAEQPSWPRIVYVPHNASVYINCTTDSSDPFWSINPAEDELDSFLQFATRGEDLNNEGLYEIEVAPGMTHTLRLLINNTEINNQTKIECVGRTVTLKTVVFLYGKLMCSAWWANPFSLSGRVWCYAMRSMMKGALHIIFFKHVLHKYDNGYFLGPPD